MNTKPSSKQKVNFLNTRWFLSRMFQSSLTSQGFTSFQFNFYGKFDLRSTILKLFALLIPPLIYSMKCQKVLSHAPSHLFDNRVENWMSLWHERASSWGWKQSFSLATEKVSRRSLTYEAQHRGMVNESFLICSMRAHITCVTTRILMWGLIINRARP